MKITAVHKSNKAIYADDYRHLQRAVTRLSGDQPPPCYYCNSRQIWYCRRTAYECRVFQRYCLDHEYWKRDH